MRIPNPIRVNVIRRVEGADDSTGQNTRNVGYLMTEKYTLVLAY
jgi:hypothetical protein